MSLEANRLGVTFGVDWVFRDLSFSVHGGDRTALIGPSGSGKSLLLRCLALLHPFDEGAVSLRGRQVSGTEVPRFRSQVMYLPQRIADVEGTVEEFLRTPFLFAAHSSKQFSSTSAQSYLGAFARDASFLQKLQRDLSGGERQIVSLVRALMLDPQFLLLDEFTSAMDAKAADASFSLVRQWASQDESRAFVWVTHDRGLAEKNASEFVEIQNLGKAT